MQCSVPEKTLELGPSQGYNEQSLKLATSSGDELNTWSFTSAKVSMSWCLKKGQLNLYLKKNCDCNTDIMFLFPKYFECLGLIASVRKNARFETTDEERLHSRA